jgi:hypothetical protein
MIHHWLWWVLGAAGVVVVILILNFFSKPQNYD